MKSDFNDSMAIRSKFIIGRNTILLKKTIRLDAVMGDARPKSKYCRKGWRRQKGKKSINHR